MAQNKDNVHSNHRKRMRERFQENGFDGFQQHEILEFLLFFAIPRVDTNELAHKVLDEYKTLANVFEADSSALAKFPGLGEISATLLTMIPLIAREYEKSKCDRDKLLHNTEAVGRFACALMKGKINEEFALICLDSHRRVHWSGIITKGATEHVDIPPRLVVSEVLRHNAQNVIFVHNHPNGSLTPTPADRATTETLVHLLKGIDANVLDHVIVYDNRYFSMAEAGFNFSI